MLTLHWNAFEYNKGIAVEIRTGKRRLGECGCPMRIGTAFEQAEKEVQDLHQRTKEGMETARLSGKQIGQKEGATLNVKKKEPMKKQIRALSRDFDGSNTDLQVMKITGLAKNTYYKYKKELLQERLEGD